MHILINMNYIGFYLSYLPQSAKLINVLSSVLTQLFYKVKVRFNTIFSGQPEHSMGPGRKLVSLANK